MLNVIFTIELRTVILIIIFGTYDLLNSCRLSAANEENGSYTVIELLTVTMKSSRKFIN